MKHSKINARNLTTLALLLVTLVGAIAWQQACWPFGDDYIYGLLPPDDVACIPEVHTWMAGARPWTGLSEFWDALVVQYKAYNGRLSNFLYMPVTMLPFCVDKLISGTLIFVMFVSLLVVGLPRPLRLRPWYVAFAVFLMWVVFPWNNFMQSTDFIFNYPLPTIALLAFLGLYRRFDSFSTRRKCAVLALAFVVAWIHEAFAITLLAWIFTDTLLRNPKSWGRWFLMLSVVAGIGVILHSAIAARLDLWSENRVIDMYSIRNEAVFVFFNMSTVAIAVCMGLCARNFCGAEEWKSFFLPAAASAFVGMSLCFVLGLFRRERWPADVFMVLIFLRFSAFAFPRFRAGVHRGILLCCSMAFAFVYAVWFAGLVSWQRKVTDVKIALEKSVSPRYSTDSDFVYGPLMHSYDIPAIYMGMADPIYDKRWFHEVFASYWIGCPSVDFLPSDWKGKPFREWPSYDGNAGVRGEYPILFMDKPYAGHLIVYGGDLPFADAPLVALLSWVKELTFGPSKVIHPYVVSEARVLPDSTQVYRISVALPYTFADREILRIDTVAAR